MLEVSSPERIRPRGRNIQQVAGDFSAIQEKRIRYLNYLENSINYESILNTDEVTAEARDGSVEVLRQIALYDTNISYEQRLEVIGAITELNRLVFTDDGRLDWVASHGDSETA